MPAGGLMLCCHPKVDAHGYLLHPYAAGKVPTLLPNDLHPPANVSLMRITLVNQQHSVSPNRLKTDDASWTSSRHGLAQTEY